jgi:hypothetical protein
VNVPPALRYSLLRLTLFAAVLVVLALLGMRGVLLLVAAVLVSGLASYSLLSRERDAMARSVNDRVDRVRRRMDERTRAEDADAAAAPPAAAPPATPHRPPADDREVPPGEQRPRG